MKCYNLLSDLIIAGSVEHEDKCIVESETSLLIKLKWSAFYAPDNGPNPLLKQNPHPGYSPSGREGLFAQRGGLHLLMSLSV